MTRPFNRNPQPGAGVSGNQADPSLVLVVDDDMAICRLATRQLSAAGYRCQSAHSVREANECLVDGAFHLILCDIAMPGGSGMDLLADAKARYPDMAIVMLTGTDSPVTAHQAFTLGADGYLLKPFEKNELLIQVAGALQRRALSLENRQYRQQLESKVVRRTAELQEVNARLQKKKVVLKARTRELKEMNTALEVLLKRSDAAKAELQDNLSVNVRKVIHPYLRKIIHLGLTPRQQAYMEVIQATLKDMVGPMARHLEGLDPPLTPAELEVAQLIRQGKRTKEIAEVLNLSVNTILTHRYHIRKKLGLLGKRAGLHAKLQSLEQ